MNANTGLVFLAYKANQKLKSIISSICEDEPEYDFISEDDVRNQVFVVKDDDMKLLIDKFKEIDTLYITDGHHRAAAAYRVRKIKKAQNPKQPGKEE